MDEDGEPVPDGWPEDFGPGPRVGMRPGYSVIEATNWYAYVSNNPVKYVDPTGDQQIPGQSRALIKVPDELVESWRSDWVSTMNDIDTLENKISDLRSEQRLLSREWNIKRGEMALKFLPLIVASILEIKNTGSVQTLAETLYDAMDYIDVSLDIYEEWVSIPSKIEMLETEIELKKLKADNLLKSLEGQAKLKQFYKSINE